MTSEDKNYRELEARRAFDRLGPIRVRAFLDAIQIEGGCLAIALVGEQLAEGATPEAIFFDGEKYGFSLNVKGRGRKFRISFGCVAGPMAGDGGEWEVEFDRDGRVVRCEGDTIWRS